MRYLTLTRVECILSLLQKGLQYYGVKRFFLHCEYPTYARRLSKGFAPLVTHVLKSLSHLHMPKFCSASTTMPLHILFLQLDHSPRLHSLALVAKLLRGPLQPFFDSLFVLLQRLGMS
jgi:hypothetical protein